MSILTSRKLGNRAEDLPSTNSLLKRTLSISIPAAMETLFVGLITLADTIMVGSVGKEALAAVSISNQPVFITLAACIGLNAGVIAIISRRHGEGNREGANRTLRQAMLMGIITSLVMSVLAFFLAEPFLLLAGAKSDTIELAKTYFRIVSFALVANYLRLIICSALRACGNTRTTLVTNIVANLVNIFLNYCLIGGNLGFPELGVTGAAIATVTGNVIALVIAFLAVYKRKNSFLSISFLDDWKLDSNTCKSILKISSNAFIEQLFMRIGFFLNAMIINNLGTDRTAANAIINSVIALGFNITDGFSIGASTLVGQSLGEKRVDKAIAYGRLSQIISFFLSFIMISVSIIFREPLSRLFLTDDDISVVYMAADVMKIAAFVLLPQSLQWVTTGILRGAGDTKYTARSSMISVMIIRPVVSFLLCYPIIIGEVTIWAGLGLLGAWLGMFIDQALRFILNNARFQNLKWAKINV